MSEFEYYLIVVCRGKLENLPKCLYTNPYTGEKCTEPRKFRTLVPSLAKSGDKLDMFFFGCKDHTYHASNQISQRINYKKGITGLQKADRRSKVWRKKLSECALKQISEGKSIFSPDNIRDKNIPPAGLTTGSIPKYKDTIETLGLDIDLNEIENRILLDKERYLMRGNLNDVCYYYITFFEETTDYFKLGVTTDIERRSKDKYSGYTYKSFEILYSASRSVIADLEYKVKLEFKEKIVLGNEGFNIKDKDIILDFVNKLISEI